MTLEKLYDAIRLAEENARGNNREGCLEMINKCYEIIKTLKPVQAKFKTELDALSDIALSLREIKERR